MKKIILGVAIAAVALASCGKQPDTQTTQTQTGAQPNPYASMPQFDDITKKVPAKIRELPAFQACAGQAVVSCSGTAARNQADETKDPTWCDAIPDDTTKKSCKDSLAYAQVLASGSVDDCATLENNNLKTQCKTRLTAQKAVSEGKIEMCDALVLPKVELGSGAIAGLPMLPTGMDDKERFRDADDCRMQVIQRGDRTKITPESCNVIQTAEVKAQCSALVSALRPAPAEGNE